MIHDIGSDALERLRLVIHALTGSPGEPDTPELLVSQAIAAIGASGGVLGIVRDGVWIDVVTSRGYSTSRVAAFSPLTVGPTYPLTDAVFRREPVWLPTIAELSARYPALAGRTRSQAMVTLPLVLGEEVIGVLGVSFDDGPHEFTSDERTFLLTIADMCAVVLRRWQLGVTVPMAGARCAKDRCVARAASTHRAEGLAVLARQLAAATTTEEVGAVAAEYLPPVLGAAVAFVGVVDEGGDTLLIQPGSVAPREIADRYARRPLTDRLPITDAVRTDQAVYLAGADDRRRRYPHTVADAGSLGITACAVLPVHDSVGRILGAVSVSWPREVGFDSTLRAQLALIANLCGQTLERARLHDGEHLFVSALQQRLLRPLPRLPGMDAHAVYRPAHGVRMGGDFYAGVRLDERRLAVLVGDVAGHGMAAAADMAQLCTLMCALIADGAKLGDAVDRVERTRLLTGGDDAFATMVVAVVDLGRHTLTYLHVGHPPLLVRQRDRRVVQLPNGWRPLLGLGAGRAAAAEAPFEAGDVLVAYTDGVVERRTEPLDTGIGRLAQRWRPRTATPRGCWARCSRTATRAALRSTIRPWCWSATADARRPYDHCGQSVTWSGRLRRRPMGPGPSGRAALPIAVEPAVR